MGIAECTVYNTFVARRLTLAIQSQDPSTVSNVAAANAKKMMGIGACARVGPYNLPHHIFALLSLPFIMQTNNAQMSSVPGHPFMWRLAEFIRANITYEGNAADITGPALITNLLKVRLAAAGGYVGYFCGVRGVMGAVGRANAL